jgi:hypothetical protein
MTGATTMRTRRMAPVTKACGPQRNHSRRHGRWRDGRPPLSTRGTRRTTLTPRSLGAAFSRGANSGWHRGEIVRQVCGKGEDVSDLVTASAGGKVPMGLARSVLPKVFWGGGVTRTAPYWDGSSVRLSAATRRGPAAPPGRAAIPPSRRAEGPAGTAGRRSVPRPGSSPPRPLRRRR